jgi:DNA ligase-1
MYNGLDGELILGEHDSTVFRRTTSAVSSYAGEPDVQFWVFDCQVKNTPFHQRYDRLVRTCRDFAGIKIVHHVVIDSHPALRRYEETALEAGYEGVMVRSMDGPYKEGRATVREGSLLKVKRFEDAEAEIVGFEERMHNANEATVNALGHTERSSHAENMVGRGDLGALLVKGANGKYKGIEFNIGTGFTDSDRDWFWAHRDTLMGQVVKFKYFPMGSDARPRFPVFLGLRPPGL